MQRIILASQSPRRRQLLEWAEVPFIVVTANTEELIPANTPVDEVPIVIAREKANVVIRKINDYTGGEGEGAKQYDMPVLAADTIVVLDGEIINKPIGRQDAIDILQRLSGRKHNVITGVVILYNGREISFSNTTEVTFHHLTPEQIAFYVDKYQPYDKAGAYAIQEWIGVIGIKSIHGDFYNVMGLPVSKVVQELQRLES
jgi:septum formation protein